MMYRVVLAMFAIGLWFVAPVDAACTGASPTWNATADQASFKECVRNAQNGDTVNIASGSFSITSALGSYCSLHPTFDGSFCLSATNGDTKYITIKGADCTLDGAGIPTSCPTVITDAVTRSSDPASMFRWLLRSGGLTRISNLEIKWGAPSGGCSPAGCTALGSTLVFQGTTDSLRIDHVRFTGETGSPTFIAMGITALSAYIRGVVDHNLFDVSRGAIAIQSNNGTNWGGSGASGDNSFAVANTLGGAEAMFYENNRCYNDQSVGSGLSIFCHDGQSGTRIVWRYNDMRASQAGVHGTDHAHARGARQTEYYNNTFTGPDGSSAWNLGGATASAPQSNRSGIFVCFNNTLTTTNGTMATICDGSYFRQDAESAANPYGQATGSNPYDVNTPGEACWPCLDQTGTGVGDLMNTLASGGPKNVTKGNIVDHAYQALDPAYCWNNVINGAAAAGNCGSTQAVVEVGRDIINNGTTAKSGYTAYTYPHPLVTGELQSPKRFSPPLNLRLVKNPLAQPF